MPRSLKTEVKKIENKKPKQKPLVILLAGLPGTGKSTLARNLAYKYNIEHISTDSVRKRIFRYVKHEDFGKGFYSSTQRQVVYDTINYTLYTLLKYGIGSVLDGTYYLERLRSKVQRICYRWDARFFLVIVKCPDSISKRRFEEREKRNRRTLSDANYSVYEKFKQIFEPTNLHHINVTVTNDYQEIVRKIDNVIKKYSIR